MKSPIPEAEYAEVDFQIQPLFVMSTFQMAYLSSWTWHNHWKILTINLKNKSYHFSTDWSKFYL